MIHNCENPHLTFAHPIFAPVEVAQNAFHNQTCNQLLQALSATVPTTISVPPHPDPCAMAVHCTTGNNGQVSLTHEHHHEDGLLDMRAIA